MSTSYSSSLASKQIKHSQLNDQLDLNDSIKSEATNLNTESGISSFDSLNITKTSSGSNISSSSKENSSDLFVDLNNNSVSDPYSLLNTNTNTTISQSTTVTPAAVIVTSTTSTTSSQSVSSEEVNSNDTLTSKLIDSNETSLDYFHFECDQFREQKKIYDHGLTTANSKKRNIINNKTLATNKTREIETLTGNYNIP
jgi:hypothetical protein